MTDKKRLLSKIKEKENNKISKKRGIIAVLAHKDLILEAKAYGYSLKSIYQTLDEEGLMPVSYVSFSRLVKKYLTEVDENSTENNQLSKDEKNTETNTYKPNFDSTKKRLI